MSRAIDPRLLDAVPATKRLLAHYAALQLIGAALTIAQAVVLARIVSDVVRLQPASTVVGALLVLAALMSGRALVAGVQEWVGARGSLQVRADLRHGVLTAIRRLGPTWAKAQPSGRLVTAAGPGLEALDGYLSRALPALVSAAVVPVAVLGWITATDWRTGAILAFVLPLVPLFMALVGVSTGRRMQRQYETLARMSGHFLDLVSGLTTLRVYGRAQHQVETVHRATDSYRRHTMATLRTAFLSGLILDLVATLSIAIVAVDVGLRLDHGHLALATALTILLLAPELFAPLRAMGAQHHATEEGRTAGGAALDVIAEAASDEVAGPAPTIDARAVIADGAVYLDAVSVTYPGRDDAALADVTLSVLPGDVVALRGRSGAGKSTVLSCVLAFTAPSAGTVLVGTADQPLDLARADRAAWRENIAWLPQRPCPTQATVAAEVGLGDPLATAEQVADVIAVCHAPHPDTPLGEDGNHVSAGQLRRVALARALLRVRRQVVAGCVPLVLLDEPSEDLDRITEGVVASVVGSLAGQATVLLATHSARLVAVADRVVDLQDGRVVGDCAQHPVRSLVAALPPYALRAHADSGPPRPRRTGRVLPLRGSVRVLATAGALSGLAGLAGLALTATSIWLICRAAQHPNVQALEIAVVGVRTFALGRALLRYLERLLSHDGALQLLADVRTRVFAALVPLVPTGVDLRRGDLLRRFVTDVDGVQEGLVRAVVPLLGAALTVAGSVTLAGLLVPSAGAVLAAGLFVGLVVAPTLARLVAGPGDRIAALAAERDSAANTLIDGLAELIAYGADAAATATVAARGAEVLQGSRRSAAGAAIGVTVAGVASAAAMPLVLVSGAQAASAGRLSGVTAAVLIAGVLAGFDAVSGVPAACAAWSRFRAGLTRVSELLATPVPVPEPRCPAGLPGGMIGLVVEGACVAPAADAPLAVIDATLALRPGKRIALVGPSGCGKSTLLSATLRLLPIDHGTIDVGVDDGSAVRRLPLREIGSADVPPLVAGSLQGDHVFDVSLRDNVRLVRPEATDADLDVIAARVGLSGLLSSLPTGWGTPAGPDGANLSGGQRQRLLLARALLAAPAVLVLDEPTAHLDVETEQAVMTDLLDGTRGQTVLMSTHRMVPDGAFERVVDMATVAAYDGNSDISQDLRPDLGGPLLSVCAGSEPEQLGEMGLTRAGVR